MSRRVFAELGQTLPPHPLMPSGYRFPDGARPIVTEWSEVLPPVEFSRAQLLLLGGFARGMVPLGIDLDSPVVKLGAYISPKITFDRQSGCWRLPLKADHDIDPRGKKRARYASVTVSELGYEGQLAHRATVETFAGARLASRETPVDHRCRAHSCCNPYHLRAVTSQENNHLGIDARRHARQPSLTALPPGDSLTYAQLATILTAISPDIAET